MMMTSKPTLVLLPGLGNNARIWAAQVAEFSDEYTVVIPDYRVASSIDEMADCLLQQVSAERFSLVGYSLGGYIALNLIQKIPERIERLAFISSSPYADSEQAIKQRKYIIEAVTKDYNSALNTLAKAVTYADGVNTKSARDTLSLMGQELGAEVFCRHQEAVMQRPDCRSILASINHRVAVLVGENDVVTPVSANQFLADNIKGAAVHVIAKAGHLLPLEKPNEVTVFLRQWLALT